MNRKQRPIAAIPRKNIAGSQITRFILTPPFQLY
jgi:hypothetical protein